MNLEGCFVAITHKDKWVLDYVDPPTRLLVSITEIPMREREKSIREVFNFNGTTFLDLGVFSKFLMKEIKEGKIPTWNEIVRYRERCVDWINNSKPDFACALDIPSLINNPPNVKAIKTEWSLLNYLYFKEMTPHLIDPSIKLVPGLTSFSEKSVLAVKLRTMMRLKEEPELLALCGQVPLIRFCEYRPRLAMLSLYTTHQFVKAFPNSDIHVYGAGGYRWYSLIRLLGAKSADYSFWAVSAGWGRIVVPTTGRDGYTHKRASFKTKEGGRKFYVRRDQDLLTCDDLTGLEECDCWVCRSQDHSVLEFNRGYRFIHNLHNLIKRNDLVDRFCRDNDQEGLIKHIRESFKDSRIKDISEYAIKLSEECA